MKNERPTEQFLDSLMEWEGDLVETAKDSVMPLVGNALIDDPYPYPYPSGH